MFTLPHLFQVVFYLLGFLELKNGIGIQDYRAALAQLPAPQGDGLQNAGILRIRGIGSLNPPNIPTTCPTSMAWLVYLKATKANFPDFAYTIEYTDSEVPQFKMGENLFSHPHEFDGGEFTLEPRVDNVGVNEKQRLALERVEQMRESLHEAFTNITNAYLYGYHLLSDMSPEWIQRSVDEIRARVVVGNGGIEQQLVAGMEDACQTLSDQLGENTYFLDSLRKDLDDKTSVIHMNFLTMLDVKLAAPAILIMKCFENEHLPYCSKIHGILYRFITLWAHADIVYSWFVKEKHNVWDYTTRLQNDEASVYAELSKAKAQFSRGQGIVYKISLLDGNDWGLNKGNYAFKLLKPSARRDNIEGEACSLLCFPYENVISLKGVANLLAEDNDPAFLVLDWISRGDLSSQMENLTWTSIKKILRGIAYAVYLVHKTIGGTVVDLKPPNILLDEADNIILCDFGLFMRLEKSSRVLTAHHCTMILLRASHARDVFAYGMILFQLLTDQAVLGAQFDITQNGYLFGRGVDQYIDEGKDLRVFIKQHLLDQAGGERSIIEKLLRIAANCVSLKNAIRKKAKVEYLRPSALQILTSLQDLGI